MRLRDRTPTLPQLRQRHARLLSALGEHGAPPRSEPCTAYERPPTSSRLPPGLRHRHQRVQTGWSRWCCHRYDHQLPQRPGCCRRQVSSISFPPLLFSLIHLPALLPCVIAWPGLADQAMPVCSQRSVAAEACLCRIARLGRRPKIHFHFSPLRVADHSLRSGLVGPLLACLSHLIAPRSTVSPFLRLAGWGGVCAALRRIFGLRRPRPVPWPASTVHRLFGPAANQAFSRLTPELIAECERVVSKTFPACIAFHKPSFLQQLKNGSLEPSLVFGLLTCAARYVSNFFFLGPHFLLSWGHRTPNFGDRMSPSGRPSGGTTFSVPHFPDLIRPQPHRPESTC